MASLTFFLYNWRFRLFFAFCVFALFKSLAVTKVAFVQAVLFFRFVSPIFVLFPSSSTKLSSLVKYMLQRVVLREFPCGTPIPVLLLGPPKCSYFTGVLKIFHRVLNNKSSSITSFSIFINLCWSIVSKHFSISESINQGTRPHVRTVFIAVCTPLCGLKPWLEFL